MNGRNVVTDGSATSRTMVVDRLLRRGKENRHNKCGKRKRCSSRMRRNPDSTRFYAALDATNPGSKDFLLSTITRQRYQ